MTDAFHSIRISDYTNRLLNYPPTIMWPYPRIIAHRGGGTLAPENTIAAMQCGLAHGFHAVEFDVMLAKDGVPILMHDAFLGRTVAGSGNIFDYTASELGDMDAGRWFGDAFLGEAPPTYLQVLDFCQKNGLWMNVEIKPAPGFEIETGRIVGQVTRQFFAEQIAAVAAGGDPVSVPLFSSFSFDALVAAKDAAPEIPRGLLLSRIPHDWRNQLDALDAVALHTNHLYLTSELTSLIRDAGFSLFCYTVNEPARAREIMVWGVDAFCTDRIDLIGPSFS